MPKPQPKQKRTDRKPPPSPKVREGSEKCNIKIFNTKRPSVQPAPQKNKHIININLHK